MGNGGLAAERAHRDRRLKAKTIGDRRVLSLVCLGREGSRIAQHPVSTQFFEIATELLALSCVEAFQCG